MSVLGYIGLMLLGGVPVVGFIAFIVMAISSKNKNIKNFSLAWIIISLIGIVLSIIFFAAFSSIFYSMADELTSASIYY